jgi:acyl-coenzyme A thioesterase PaaI-like protein
VSAVPPHAPNCFGCGPGNDAGLALTLDGDGSGERLGGEITIDTRFEGAPGIAHGGTIATILDDASGRFMYLTGEPAVTKRIEVDYIGRVPIGRPLRVEAWIGSRNERGLEICSELRDGTAVLARATARMRFVDPEHFLIDPGAGDIGAHMARTGLNGTGQMRPA